MGTKRGVVSDLIEKGKKILDHPDKPKFLEGHVQRIEVGWDDTKQKAQDRLKLLTETKDAWVGYAENNETIATEVEILVKNAATEKDPLPQGDKVPQDAQDFK